MARGTPAGKAFVELSLSTAKFRRALDTAQKKLHTMGASIAKIGAGIGAGVGALAAPALAAVKHFTDLGDSLDKMSQRTGVSVESLSQMKYMAEQSGSTIETFEGSLKGMTNQILSLGEAGDSGGGIVDLFDSVGASFASLSGLSPEEQFLQIANGIAKIEDPTKRAGVAMRIFGEQGQQMLPLIMSDMEALRKQSDALGLTIGGAQAKAAAELSDAWHNLTSIASGLVLQIGSHLAGTLTRILKGFKAVSVQVLEWVKANKGLVVAVAKTVAVIGLIGAALTAVGVGLMTAGAVVGGFSAAFSALAAVVGAVLSPIGLVVAAVVALGAAIVQGMGGVGAVIDMLKKRFSSLLGVVGDSFQAIVAAVSAGDLSTAVDVLWKTIQLLFAQGIAGISGKWQAFKTFFITLWSEAVFGLARLFIQGSATLERAWIKTTSFLRDTWTNLTSGFRSAWSTFQNFMARGILKLSSMMDEEFDLEGALGELEKDFDRQQQKIEKQKEEDISKRDQEKEKRLSSVDRDERSTLEFLEQDRQRKRKQIDEDSIRSINEAQKNLDDARLAHSKAMQRAAKAREVGEIEDDTTQNILGDLEGLLSGVQMAGKQVDSVFKTRTQFGGQNASLVFAPQQRSLVQKQISIAQQHLEEQKKTTKEAGKKRTALEFSS